LTRPIYSINKKLAKEETVNIQISSRDFEAIKNVNQESKRSEIAFKQRRSDLKKNASKATKAVIRRNRIIFGSMQNGSTRSIAVQEMFDDLQFGQVLQPETSEALSASG
jgi:hypothetical protein